MPLLHVLFLIAPQIRRIQCFPGVIICQCAGKSGYGSFTPAVTIKLLWMLLENGRLIRTLLFEPRDIFWRVKQTPALSYPCRACSWLGRWRYLVSHGKKKQKWSAGCSRWVMQIGSLQRPSGVDFFVSSQLRHQASFFVWQTFQQGRKRFCC